MQTVTVNANRTNASEQELRDYIMAAMLS